MPCLLRPLPARALCRAVRAHALSLSLSHGHDARARAAARRDSRMRATRHRVVSSLSLSRSLTAPAGRRGPSATPSVDDGFHGWRQERGRGGREIGALKTTRRRARAHQCASPRARTNAPPPLSPFFSCRLAPGCTGRPRAPRQSRPRTGCPWGGAEMDGGRGGRVAGRKESDLRGTGEERMERPCEGLEGVGG